MKVKELEGVRYSIINAESKKGQFLINQYDNCEGYSLWDVYEHYSRAKEEAFQWCSKQSEKLQGGLTVIMSHSKFNFTCGFCCSIDGVRALICFTRDNNYLIFLK